MHTQCFWGKSLLLIFLLLHSSVRAANDLKKPPLFKDGLTKLKKGLEEHLPTTKYHVKKWAPGWTTEHCKRAAAKANPPEDAAKIETFNVHYDDCSSPWTLCRHTDSPDPLKNFIENFGRIPVGARSYVRGAISLPERIAKQNHAWNGGDFIAMFNRLEPGRRDRSEVAVWMHEVGHSLDRHAFADSKFSESKKWQMEYDQDSKVADSYAATRQTENVAQHVVVATYDLVVPGGFKALSKDWKSIVHQLEAMKRAQRDGGNLLVPGGTCTRRVENSKPVQIPIHTGGKHMRRPGKRQALQPDVGLEDELDLIERADFSSGPSRRAALAKEMPDVELAEGLEVIVPRSEVSSTHTGAGDKGESCTFTE